MTEFSLREARPEDFGEILALWNLLDRHTGLPDTPENLMTFHQFSPDLFLVAEAGGRIVGTIIGGWDGWRAQIARLATHPESRRQGIAQALVSEVERRLNERGARRVYALVDRRNTLSEPFWLAHGYAANENIIQYSRNLE